jgi:hypothetical protein
LTATVSDLIDYPGITELMDARVTYLTSYPGSQGSPDISNINNAPANIILGGDLTITAEVSGASDVMLAYRYGGHGIFSKMTMLDDGTQNDGAANDGVYGAALTGTGNKIQYYIYAENNTAGRFSPERAAYEYYELESQIAYHDLVINEVLASNTETVTDQNGEFDDWLELHNNTDFDISTSGLVLSDSGLLNQWVLPDVMVESRGYLIVWADQDSIQDGLHASFQLASISDALTLFYTDSTIIDSVSFQNEESDISLARIPNGTGPFVSSTPTFNGNNESTGIAETPTNESFLLFPNPANEFVNMEVQNSEEGIIQIRTLDGRLMIEKNIPQWANLTSINTSQFSNGLYFVSLYLEGVTHTEKMIITH